MADRVGQLLGNFRLTRLLGQGGFAEVYLGEHVRLGTYAAVKVLHTRLAGPKEVENFEKEAQTIARLEHPHIVRVFDFNVINDTPFLVMSYASGGTLRQRHPKGTQLPLLLVVQYVRQIADALQYAHEERFIHRDVKPENMLLGRRNEILLSDFGIATIAHSTVSLSVQAVVGTAPYMAPEQLHEYPRPASDQYSLGIVVYEWLCGERPFEGSFAEIVGKHLTMPPPLLRKKMATISPEVEQVVMIALAKDHKERFGSIQAFATALERASQPEDVHLHLANPSSQLRIKEREQKAKEEQARLAEEEEQKAKEEQEQKAKEEQARLAEEEEQKAKEEQEQKAKEEQARLARKKEQKAKEEQARLARQQEEAWLARQQERLARQQEEAWLARQKRVRIITSGIFTLDLLGSSVGLGILLHIWWISVICLVGELLLGCLGAFSFSNRLLRGKPGLLVALLPIGIGWGLVSWFLNPFVSSRVHFLYLPQGLAIVGFLLGLFVNFFILLSVGILGERRVRIPAMSEYPWEERLTRGVWKKRVGAIALVGLIILDLLGPSIGLGILLHIWWISVICFIAEFLLVCLGIFGLSKDLLDGKFGLLVALLPIGIGWGLVSWFLNPFVSSRVHFLYLPQGLAIVGFLLGLFVNFFIYLDFADSL